MLQFQFKPTPGDSTLSPPIFSGHGRLTLLLNGQDVWSDDESDELQGSEAYWDGLLHHLAKAWPYLIMEDPYPLDFNPISPAGFLDEAMRGLRSMGLSEKSFIEEEARIFAFNNRHNLAAGMPNILLPPIFVLREGKDMRVVAESMDSALPVEEVLRTLEELGNSIAQFVHHHSPRGKIILEAWSKRNQLPTREETYAMITGMSLDNIKLLVANDNPEKLLGPPLPHAPSPMLLAARMTQHKLEVEEIRSILARMAKVRLGKLDKDFLQLRHKAYAELANIREQKYYRQGYHLAQWLREQLNYSDTQTFDSESWLKNHGVTIEKSKRGIPPELDALACWNSKEAAIIINKSGTHAGKEWGEKASLAHEMAHLLLDTDHALPSVDILGGKMPALVEKRANAFAAELLLPRSQVITHLPETLTYETIKKWMDLLVSEFKVGRELTGNQISNLLKDKGELTPVMSKNIHRAIGEQGRDPNSYGWWNG
ncbi:MAG: ImmA/IrrE family metallo-endopeptidase [Magnetococcales bacterium]|nr:ImmA/IrrE family metallo-endopeptidase [Magnetococcales bacterium]NGZ29550.1 ImmA/IrrE family metallo-endopeptidase [Magnetococcales bacterium]